MRRIILGLFLLQLALSGNLSVAASPPKAATGQSQWADGKAAQAVGITLRDIPLRSFASAPAPMPEAVPPAFKERRFPLAEARNFAAVEKRLGGLTAVQKKYLEEHRFLLLPKKAFFSLFADGYAGELHDEMLDNFDGIGGPPMRQERRPEHAVLLGPDVFLQALHTYFSQRLKTIEKNELSASLETLLANLYANAKSLRHTGGKDVAAHWQRLQAQMAVPLVVLKNCEKPDAQAGETPDTAREDKSDTLARALEIFAPYRADLSPELAAAVEKELEAVYAASGSHPSQLGLAPSYAPQGGVDYTQFKARGHYETSSASRAYFRAMIWLGQLGWNLKTEQGLADSVNFALAMSHDSPGGASHRQAWQRIMEVSSFFVGYPDAPSYPEWQRFLGRHSTAGLTSRSSADTALLRSLAADVENIPLPQGPFAALQAPSATPVLTVFPQRFTIPWLVGNRLSYDENLRRDLPRVFSSLWVPAVMGSSFAQSLVPQQVKLCLVGQPNATLQGAPLDDGRRGLSPDQAARVKKAEIYLAGLKREMAALSSAFKTERAENWFSSIGTAWFHLLGALTADYSDGYPLYMRDAAFGAKQLESFMGAFTALKHDTILYEKVSYAEGGGGEDEEAQIPPVPKGFVEPNLPFWHTLLRTVSYMEEGFRAFSLYPADLEEYGALNRFKASLEFCAALAEKELRGQSLTEEEYEGIRILRLQYMAAPVDATVIPADEALSGLVVDVQTVNLNDRTGAQPLIVYEALAEPSVMLALVGNEESPRVVMGMAFNHREFITPYGSRLTDSVWKKRVYGQEQEGSFSPENALPLPAKNPWYDSLRP